MSEAFPPTRTEALARLAAMVPRAGRAYAASRNLDLPGHPHVSRLSPYLRHRLLTEPEVLQAVLGRHAPGAADKFVQEVCWRTYWKGWLEMRPQVWDDYRHELAALGEVPGLARAEAGETGIACFDAWMRELVATGYLHNHARMWVASIWIFTLRLPWQAGADLFLRHLLDGDPASNTLGWRWVAGLQTPGKHYLARAANIARYTEGRHDPSGQLNEDAGPIAGPPHPPRGPLPVDVVPDPALPTGLLLHEDDLSPGFLLAGGLVPRAHAGLLATAGRSPREVAAPVAAFARGAAEDAMTRWGGRLGRRGPLATSPAEIALWARAEGLAQVVAAHAPVGPTATALAELRALLAVDGIALISRLRPWDAAAWPHATQGFFRFREAIPALIRDFVLPVEKDRRTETDLGF